MSDKTPPRPACFGPAPMVAERRAEIRELLTGAGPSIPMGPNALFALHKDRDANRRAATELLDEVDRLLALWAAVAKTSRERKAEADGRRKHAEQLKAENEQLRERAESAERMAATAMETVGRLQREERTTEQLRAQQEERAEQAEAERDQALVDLETAKGWRDHALAERDEYRRANTQLQELATLRASERDQLKAAAQAELDRHDAEIKQLQEEQHSEARAALKNINRWRAEIRDAEAKVASLLHDIATVARHIEDGEYDDADKAARRALDIAPGVDLPGR